ncbi:mavicyanin-like [Lotus japonicus]|uniref:mavicyanin-like n=1 Tax=Lotus japonicus TaxID=34305 RepID=UPI0003E65D8E|nr:mavicyanin-like [Lotus japonicus]
MAMNMNALLLALLAATALFHCSSAQTRHVVGDSAGWFVPGNTSFYTSWAAKNTFAVGDTLVFNYAASAHNVEEVTKTNYDSCNSTSPIATYTTPPVTVTIKKTGAHYFICGVPGHCLGDQKLSINVASGSSAATPPSSTATPPSSSTTPPPPSSTTTPSPSSPTSPSPSSTVTPPPKDSAAVSLGAAGVVASTVMTIAAVFFF